jgi:hypothetical protein
MSYNPFQALDLKVPSEFHEDLTRYSRSQSLAGEKKNPLDNPFDRYVDLWMLGVCLGAREGRTLEMKGNASHTFVTGVVLATDPDRIDLLELLAIGHTGDPFIVAEARQVIDLANGFAAVGVPMVIELLKSGRGRPLWNLTEAVLEEFERKLEPIGEPAAAKTSKKKA